MEKENKKIKSAWITLSNNKPASINLLNDLESDWGWLKGFEWRVCTILPNGMIKTIHLADCWKQAAQWLEKNGYEYRNDDPSKILYDALYISTKKTIDERKLEETICGLIQKAEDGITPYEPSVNDYDKCLSNNAKMEGRMEAFYEVIKFINKEYD